MHVVLIRLNGYTSKSRCTSYLSRLPQETMTCIEPSFKKLVERNLQAVMNFKAIRREVMTLSLKIVHIPIVINISNADYQTIVITIVLRNNKFISNL